MGGPQKQPQRRLWGPLSAPHGWEIREGLGRWPEEKGYSWPSWPGHGVGKRLEAGAWGLRDVAAGVLPGWGWRGLAWVGVA